MEEAECILESELNGEHETYPEKVPDKDSDVSSTGIAKTPQNASDIVIQCKICNIKFPDVKPYEDHINGKKHDKMMKKIRMLRNFDTQANDMASAEKNSKKQSSSAEFSDLQCNVCNMQFTGFIPYSQHMKGSIHRKNAKRLELQNQLKDLPQVMQEHKNEKDVSFEEHELALDNVLPYAKCDLCHKCFTGPESFQQHVESKAHAKAETVSKLGQGTQDKYLDEERTIVLSSDQGAYITECIVCKKTLNSVHQFQEHQRSRAHQKQLKKIEASKSLKTFTLDENVDSDSVYECVDCNMEFKNPLVFEHHLMSNIHLRQLKRSRLLTTLLKYPEIIADQRQLSEEGACLELIQDVSLVESFFCTLCKKRFLGPESAFEHVTGRSHLKMQQRFQIQETVKSSVSTVDDVSNASSQSAVDASDASTNVTSVIDKCTSGTFGDLNQSSDNDADISNNSNEEKYNESKAKRAKIGETVMMPAPIMK